MDAYLKEQIEKRELEYLSFSFGWHSQYGSLVKSDWVSRRLYRIEIVEWEKAFTINIKFPLIKEIKFEYLK